MRKPLVSVVMTCFNHRKLIAEAVQSVLDQTHENLELVLIDDGSSDGTSILIQDFRDDRLRYEWQPNSGPSDATNRGLHLARGEYIALMGGDDVCFPHRLEQQLDQIERGYDIVFSLPQLIDDRSRDIPFYRLPVFFRDNFHDEAELFGMFFTGGNFLCGPSALARRDFFTRFGVFRRGLIQLQDFDLWVRSCRAGARIKLYEDPVIRYRVREHDKNLSSAKNMPRTRLELDVIYRDFFDGADPDFIKRAFPHGISEESREDEAAKDAELVFLYLNHDSAACRRIGMDKAIACFDDPPRAHALAERGLNPPELFQMMANAQPVEV